MRDFYSRKINIYSFSWAAFQSAPAAFLICYVAAEETFSLKNLFLFPLKLERYGWKWMTMRRYNKIVPFSFQENIGVIGNFTSLVEKRWHRGRGW